MQTDAITIIMNRVVALHDRWWLVADGPRGCAMVDLRLSFF